jgi:hypothetical protein
MKPNQVAANAHPSEFNIAAIAKLEEDALSKRSRTERASDAITKVGMLAEQELTTLLQLQQKICQHLGLSVIEKEDVKDFAKATDVHQLARELDQQLPER